MKRAVFWTKIPKHIASAYSKSAREEIRKIYDLTDTIYSKVNLAGENKEDFKDVEAIFSTWGMEHFTKEEIKATFPNLKYIFYGAGSVQDFAKEFLEEGVRVFSAASANAIPVSEYTVAMIMLANKLAPHAIKRTNNAYYMTQKPCLDCVGNYKTTIGIIGAGKIGSMVVEKIKAVGVKANFLAYDPFLSDERAEALGVTKCSLEELFANSDVITNHLANKDELAGVLNYSLFSKMKPKATFINSGRGRQVVEKDLVKALREVKTRNAILDVTWPEPPKPFSAIRRMKNIYITPHIAGSLGGEIARMGDYMVEDAVRLEANESPVNEVTLEMLKTLA